MSNIDQAGNAPIPAVRKATVAAEGSPDIQPTADTMPASLRTVGNDFGRSLETLSAIFPAAELGPLGSTDRELLTNSATVLKAIVEAGGAALGMLARAGIKPKEETAG